MKRALFLAVLTALHWAATPPALAADPQYAEEYKLKAAFIYNFTQFVEWPAEAFGRPEDAFNICVFGKDPFGDALKALEKRQVRGRPINVAYLRQTSELRSCHILYVDTPKEASANGLSFKAIAEWPLLSVSSGEFASEQGVAIGFVQQGGRLRWELNLETTRKARLKVSAKLIEIAVSVIGPANR